MDLVQDGVNWLKNRLIYMTGRGFLSMSLLVAAGLAPAISLGTFAAVAVGATALLQGYMVYRDQQYHKRRLVNDYRDEIAATLGKAPEEVDNKDLDRVAEGDPTIGLEPNRFFKQSVDQFGKKSITYMVTTVMSALTVAGLIFLVGDEPISSSMKDVFKSLPVSGTVGTFSAMVLSGFGMSLFNKVYDYVAERVLDIDHKTANERVRDIRKIYDKKEPINELQLLGVFVAATPTLEDMIEQKYGVQYHDLAPEAQLEVYKDYGRNFPLSKLTKHLNEGVMHPDELAFAVVGKWSGMPPMEPDPERLAEIQDPNIDQRVAKEEARQPRRQTMNPMGSHVVVVSGAANDNRNAPTLASSYMQHHVSSAKNATHRDRLMKQRAEQETKGPDKGV